ncbi:MAG TPA: hypothetical protein VHV55_10750 [Pirellulales bacterium]|jgi:hypothetical protein|nr:hypothetical protein [Pirellulales bacterium]
MNRRTTIRSDNRWVSHRTKLARFEWYPVAGLILISEYFLLGLLAR